jgi:membrane protease YdiL (CAAX protease family)
MAPALAAFVVTAVAWRQIGVGDLWRRVFGIACGAIVLGWLYNKTGSVLAVAVWHAAYNLGSASAAAHGSMAATVTTLVIVQAIALLIADVISRGRVLAPVRRAATRVGPDPVAVPSN